MIWLVLASLLLVTAFGELVHLELVQTTQSAIEREAERRGVPGRAAWIARRWRAIEETGAIIRVVGRVTLVMAMMLHWGHLGMATVGALAAMVTWVGTSLVPAALARHAGERLLLPAVPALRVLTAIAAPLAWLGERVEDVVARIVSAPHADEEVRGDMLDALGDAEREGGIDPVSADLIENVVEFSSTTVSEVMTPRTEIEALAYTDDLRAIAAFIGSVGHSRIPVYEGSIDRIIGVLHIRDLMPRLGSGVDGFRLADLLRAPILVPETKRVRDLLVEFQRAKGHLAVVVDEFGGTAGLATIEDILDEIVGEIEDEHDTGAEQQSVQAIGPGAWRVLGRARIDEVNEATGLAIAEAADHDTIAGHLLARVGRIPLPGEVVQCLGFGATITRAQPNRIDEIEIWIPGAAAARSPQSNSSPRNVEAR